MVKKLDEWMIYSFEMVIGVTSCPDRDLGDAHVLRRQAWSSKVAILRNRRTRTHHPLTAVHKQLLCMGG